MFFKATSVAVYLALSLAWATPTTQVSSSSSSSTTPVFFPNSEHVPSTGLPYRLQLLALLRDFTRFLEQRNFAAVDAQGGSAAGRHGAAGGLVNGLAALVAEDPGLVEPALPDALIEGAQLGLLKVTAEEREALMRIRAACAGPPGRGSTLGSPTRGSLQGGFVAPAPEEIARTESPEAMDGLAEDGRMRTTETLKSAHFQEMGPDVGRAKDRDVSKNVW
ncbi:uncharacterized protein BXZ73DRAFT_82139 [Epithele typhae]|uniref:uncharacterized protein n=1 Tax=Epithele typhae TaxID=378194 RepID=UPI00200891AF|nr:uncharacterized protein BXZ73DRAFT_82139 [Epithele typhae]KAH9912772.1 hypothetical protein BXZ73DRAFT_82139 [Epithele typhae]